MSVFDVPDPGTPLGPPSRRMMVVAAVLFGAALVFGAALFTGNIPGLGGHITSNVTLDGREYYSELYEIPFPNLGSNTTSPAPVVFHNVTFWVWETGWYSQYGSYVHGNGTEVNGTAYPFVLGGLMSSPNRTTLFISPDDRFATAWSGEFYLELMVEIVPASPADAPS